jgi:hypothetical protein
MRLPKRRRDKIEQLLKGEYHAHTTEYQPILLSSAAVSAARDSHQKRTSRRDSEQFTAIRNWSRSWVGTICVPVALVAGFKKCCLKTGAYDGELRNHFFQGLAG